MDANQAPLTPEPSHCCPTCGGELRDQISWDMTARVFLAGGRALRLTKSQAVIFDAIWRARRRGGIQSLEQFAATAYEGLRDGGPECLTTISVHLTHIRAKMKSTDYTITQNVGRPRAGYRLVKCEAAA